MSKRFLPLKLSHISSGFIAVLVGYTSSVAIVFQAAYAAGADQAMINSWLLALGLGMAVTCIGLSLYYKTPILTAWSTPGAAMLATSLADIPMNEAIGAFIFSGLLITLSGITGSLDRLSRLIPAPIAAAMLAGVLMPFCLEIFTYLQQEFVLVAIMCATYLIGKRLFPLYAIPLVLVIGAFSAWNMGLFNTEENKVSGLTFDLASFVFTMPAFSLTTLISIGIPLFIVTMSSQNMPGIATMHTAGYRPPLSPIISTTGITTMLLAPFGGFAFNLAAITAAICMEKDADPDRATRYMAAVSAGVFYFIAALLGATVVALFSMSPKALILPLAGLALLGTLANSLALALDKPSHREAALVTFLVTVSGVVFFGIGAAFWGLIAGILVQQVLPSRA